MGSFRDRYTDGEWDVIVSKIEADSKNGKPVEPILHLSLRYMDVEKLKKLRISLSDYYDEYDLILLDKWIAWKS